MLPATKGPAAVAAEAQGHGRPAASWTPSQTSCQKAARQRALAALAVKYLHAKLPQATFRALCPPKPLARKSRIASLSAVGRSKQDKKPHLSTIHVCTKDLYVLLYVRLRYVGIGVKELKGWRLGEVGWSGVGKGRAGWGGGGGGLEWCGVGWGGVGSGVGYNTVSSHDSKNFKNVIHSFMVSLGY